MLKDPEIKRATQRIRTWLFRLGGSPYPRLLCPWCAQALLAVGLLWAPRGILPWWHPAEYIGPRTAWKIAIIIEPGSRSGSGGQP